MSLGSLRHSTGKSEKVAIKGAWEVIFTCPLFYKVFDIERISVVTKMHASVTVLKY